MFCSMSNSVWRGESSKTKYEKCEDIATEIYKRINITFAIKELKSRDNDSEDSDFIDSNELSNETDLFAYDKTDSLSSSITLEEDRKIININNNEEIKKPQQRVAKVKKRYRKRVKKKQRHVVQECSSDEEPLSRIVGEAKKRIKIKIVRTNSECNIQDKDDEEEIIKTSEHSSDKTKRQSDDAPDPLIAEISADTAPSNHQRSRGDIENLSAPPGIPGASISDASKVLNDATSKSEALVKQTPNEDTILDLSVTKTTDDSAALNLTAGSLSMVRAVKKKEERAECEHCKMTFSRVRGLRRHLKNRCFGRITESAEGETKVYGCSECDYRGVNEASLRRHVGVHSRGTAEKKYACLECPRRYTQRSTLRVHQLTHRGERPHSCDICQKSFTRYDTWKRHQRVHNKAIAAATTALTPSTDQPGD